MTRKPTTATATQKRINFSRPCPEEAKSTSPVVPNRVNSPIMAIARMSSIIKIPKINLAKPCRKNPRLSSTLAIIVVEEIDIIAPRKIESIALQPKYRPNRSPKKNIAPTSTTAATTAVTPTSFNFRKLKCSPTENINKTTPNSAKDLISSSLETKLNGGVFGPIRTPTKIYPRTTGCFSR